MSQSCELRCFSELRLSADPFYTTLITAFLCANTTIPRNGLGEPPHTVTSRARNDITYTNYTFTNVCVTPLIVHVTISVLS